jgi:hypothetical protein
MACDADWSISLTLSESSPPPSSALWLLLFGRVSVGLVLPRGVVPLLACQLLPIRAGMRGGSRDDGLGRQDQPIWLMLCGYKKNKATLESN